MQSFEFGTYEEFIYKRTYARWLEQKNKRENFNESVDRFKNFFIDLAKPIESEFENAIDCFLSLGVVPSMRAFYSSGDALKENHIAAYNCSAIIIDDIKRFGELLLILMNGTGVGISVERQFIVNLPDIPNELKEVERVIVADDSKYGWQNCLDEYISELYNGNICKYDLSKIRKKGERLKNFGGRASGPEVFDTLLKNILVIFEKAKGRKLRSIECHDICCHIASVVVAGGVRRSSLISLSNLSDDRMRSAKDGEFWINNKQRMMSNNSVCYTEKPDLDIFIQEWLSLMKSGSGERGIFNREACNNIVKRNGRRLSVENFVTNPCCFTGDMKLLTDKGYKKFSDLDGKSFNIVNKDGDIQQGSVWKVKEKNIVRILFRDKSEIKCTDDHIFMLNDGSECKAIDLRKKRLMPYIKDCIIKSKEVAIAGFIFGDGNLTDMNNTAKRGLCINIGVNDSDIADFFGIDFKKDKVCYYEKEYYDIAKKYNLPPVQKPFLFIPEYDESFDYDSFLCGLFSANGSVIKGRRISFKTTSKKLADQIMFILKEKYDINGYITTNKEKKIEFSNGNFLCRESYDVNISRWIDIKKFYEKISFIHKYKKKDLVDLILKLSPSIMSVKDSGSEMVYDFNEPKTNWGVVNGFIVHNSEIILRPQSFCNLSEVIVRPNDSLDTLKEKIGHAVVFGCLQSMLTDFKGVSEEFQKNCEDERLLGVSLTGVRDHYVLKSVTGESKKYLREMKKHAIKCAKEISSKLKINMPAAITTCKPSGTTSQMVNCSSGIHTRFSPYYIRRVRITKTDKLCEFLIKNGVNHNPEVGETSENCSTMVFDFPIESPKGCICNRDVTAIDQLEYWKMFQTEWCEHKPSMTVFVDNNEWLEVGAWVYKNWDIVSGIAFLPKSDAVYQLPPYEEITSQTYNDLKKKMPNINFDDLDKFEIEDTTIGAQEFACAGGSCELI